VFRIRIRIDIGRLDPHPNPGWQKDSQKWKKVKKFHVLKGWGEGFCCTVAWTSFMEA
jgi:hypothetical protein